MYTNKERKQLSAVGVRVSIYLNWKYADGHDIAGGYIRATPYYKVKRVEDT